MVAKNPLRTCVGKRSFFAPFDLDKLDNKISVFTAYMRNYFWGTMHHDFYREQINR